jgi:hypothetical protein
MSNFTEDVAIMLGDIEIYNLATAYDIQCDIVIHPGSYLTQSSLSFAYQKDFALKEIIDYQLLKMKQSGLLNHLERKYFRKISQDCQPPIRELSFRATFLSFAILVLGIIMAILSLCVENILFMFSGKQ